MERIQEVRSNVDFHRREFVERTEIEKSKEETNETLNKFVKDES